MPGLKAELATFNDTVDDVSESTHDFIWKRHRTAYLMCWAAAILLSLPFFFLAVIAVLGRQNPDTVIIIGLVMYALIPGIYYIRVSTRMDQLFTEQLRQSLESLGFTYSEKADLSTTRGYIFNGNTFSFGTPVDLEHVYSATYRGYPLRFFSYVFLMQEGKSAERVSVPVCELTVPKQLPELMVEDVNFSSMKLKPPPQTHPIALEGDFNSKFFAYGEDGADIEARQILEPDVMALLLDNYQKYGFELSGDRINIYTSKGLYRKQDYQSLLTLADTLFDKLVPETSRL